MKPALSWDIGIPMLAKKPTVYMRAADSSLRPSARSLDAQPGGASRAIVFGPSRMYGMQSDRRPFRFGCSATWARRTRGSESSPTSEFMGATR